ncbi:unnamed protein product, partial [Polarella glacialis]
SRTDASSSSASGLSRSLTARPHNVAFSVQKEQNERGGSSSTRLLCESIALRVSVGDLQLVVDCLGAQRESSGGGVNGSQEAQPAPAEQILGCA